MQSGSLAGYFALIEAATLCLRRPTLQRYGRQTSFDIITKSRANQVLMVGLAILGVAVFILGSRVLTSVGVPFQAAFKKIQAGMSEAEVVAGLGTPDEKSAQFRLGQYAGFEKEYARAADSGSSYYLIWNKGVDVVYTVGFDNAGRVTMKAGGGT